MEPQDFVAKAQIYLQTLCNVKPNRRTGSKGNQKATDFFVSSVLSLGFEIDTSSFSCLDYESNKPLLIHKDETFEVYVRPYSLKCDVSSELMVVSTISELKSKDCNGKILLLRGEICSEQLMPKDFVFYNPEHHQQIISLLENQKPAAIITATERKPEQVGALYPFPLIVDGDFDIPSVYCRNSVGRALAQHQGEIFQLQINARRLPSSANNVIAQFNHNASKKIVITAHIDAYENTPGASDNASGTVVLLLLAEMLSSYQGDNCIEIAVLNGEDHYSAGGQMDYIHRYGSEFNRILVAINIDDVGYKKGRSSYSFYECSPELEHRTKSIFQDFSGLVQGEQWLNGDHMIFVQSRIPSIAFTSEYTPELMRTVTHTLADTPDIIDNHKLVEVAQSLNALVRAL